MKFLVGIHGEGYSRARAARACEVSERTIDNALTTLISVGAIARKRGGRSTPSKVTILMNLRQFFARQVEIARQVAQNCALSAKNCALSGRIYISEEETQREEPSHFQNPLLGMTEAELSEVVRQTSPICFGPERIAAGVEALKRELEFERQREAAFTNGAQDVGRKPLLGATPDGVAACAPLAKEDRGETVSVEAVTPHGLSGRSFSPQKKPPGRHFIRTPGSWNCRSEGNGLKIRDG